MNDRIRELALQADVFEYQTYLDPVFYKSVSNEDKVKKFAELIVRECAKFLEENTGYDNSNNAWHPEPEELLEHFGVDK